MSMSKCFSSATLLTKTLFRSENTYIKMLTCSILNQIATKLRLHLIFKSDNLPKLK